MPRHPDLNPSTTPLELLVINTQSRVAAGTGIKWQTECVNLCSSQQQSSGRGRASGWQKDERRQNAEGKQSWQKRSRLAKAHTQNGIRIVLIINWS